MTLTFNRRSNEEEWMGMQTVSFEEFQQSLSDLETINHWTLAYCPTLQWLREKISKVAATHTISIMDIGSGGGDMLRKLWQTFKGQHDFDLQGIDLHPWSKISALKLTAQNMPVRFETADIFTFTPERRVDFIISSLFTHHLSDAEIIRFLQWMETHAEQGWFINDLHRHPIPYFFIKYAVRLLRYTHLVQHDAPISVMRAFTRKDWQRLLAEAHIPMNGVVIRWYMPFRYGIAHNKS